MNDRNKLARAYQEASARLRRAHDDEFHALLQEVYAEWGMSVVKRRSRQQARAAKVAAALRIIQEDS